MAERKYLFSKESSIKHEKKKTYNLAYTTVNVVNVKMKFPHKEKRSRSTNKVNLLWDELEYFLHEDEDFEIESIEKNKMIIKARRKEAFHNKFVMCKIFGTLLSMNCEFKLKIRNYQDVDFKRDLLFYDFSIETTSNLYYSGSIIIKR